MTKLDGTVVAEVVLNAQLKVSRKLASDNQPPCRETRRRPQHGHGATELNNLFQALSRFSSMANPTTAFCAGAT